MTKVRRARLVVFGLVGLVVPLVAGNWLKNVRARAKTKEACAGLTATAQSRVSGSGPLFDRLFGPDDARVMRRMPEAVIGLTCSQLERELTWYRWNLGRTVRLDETRALRQELVAALDRAQPRCLERTAEGREGADEFDRSLGQTTCQVLKTLRSTLDLPVQDASPWALAEQLERQARRAAPDALKPTP